jgi:hypothetical protein
MLSSATLASAPRIREALDAKPILTSRASRLAVLLHRIKRRMTNRR